jgi:alkylated DNA repair protein alkB family protein 4
LLLKSTSDSLVELHLDGPEGCLAKAERRQAEKLRREETSLSDDRNDCESSLLAALSPVQKPNEPSGLYIIEDFIDETEESALVLALDNDAHQWHHSSFNGDTLAKSFGVKTQFGKPGEDRLVRWNDPSKGEPDIPSYLSIFFKRLEEYKVGNEELQKLLKGFNVNECNANRYEKAKKHFLRPHFDDRFLSGPILLNLSLAGDCRMTYKHGKGERNPISLHLKRRTLQIVAGDSRWLYTHEIRECDVLSDRRLSVTFREAGDKRRGIVGVKSLDSAPFA